MGTVLDQNAIAKLPLAIRNWDDLLALVAGVQGDRYSEEGGATALGRTGGVNVHGNRSLQNNFLLDGVDNNSISTNVQELSTQVSRPSIDSIQEFKVVTSPYSAEYGRSPGAAISVTTKSGTNSFHGGAYDYYRNEQVRLEHLLQRGLPHRARPGAAAQVRERPEPVRRAPGRADREGQGVLLRRLRGHAHHPRRHPHHARAHRSTSGTGSSPAPSAIPLTGQPFPNNTIPRDRFDPVAAAIIDLLPAPNTPGANNYTRPDAQVIDNADRFLGRVDLRLSDSDNVFGRYIYTTRERVLPGWFGGIIDGTASSALGDQGMKSHGLVAGWTRILSPSLVNEFRFSYIKADSDLAQLPFGEDPPAAAGRARRARGPALQRRRHRHEHRRLLRRRREDRLPELLAQVPAHAASTSS